MSKGSLFWGNAKGKLGQLVLSNLKGQQVARAYQPNVNNPRTPAQMFQRATFAAPVQFYKHAVQALFKFAYADKKQQESDFNAFMRHNAKNAALLTREQFVNQNVPKIGRYLLSAGDLTAPAMTLSGSGSVQMSVGVIAEDIVGTQSTSEAITLGTISKAITRNMAGVINGDIVTLVFISSDAVFLAVQPYIEPGTGLPSWHLYQFRIDTTSTVEINDVLGDTVFDATNSPVSAIDLLGDVDTKAVSCVVSRPSADGVRVSTSQLVNHPDVEAVLDKMLASSHNFDNSWDDVCMASWAAADKAVLEGSLLREEQSASAGAITVSSLAIEKDGAKVGSNIFDVLPSGTDWTGATLVAQYDGRNVTYTNLGRSDQAYIFRNLNNDDINVYVERVSSYVMGDIANMSTVTIDIVSITIDGKTYPFVTA